MIHRAPFGSMERFCGLLIEHFAGNFPTWLAPEQARILPITSNQDDYAQSILEKMKSANIRAQIDTASDKLGAKIRRAEVDKVPYMLIIGAKEAEAGQVNIRSRVNKANEGDNTIETFIDLLRAEIKERKLPVN